MIDNSKEYIICAACHFDSDEIVGSHNPKNIKSGYVMAGRRHHNVFNLHAQLVGFEKHKERMKDGKVTQGFLTSLDRFVTRSQACEIAIDAGQVQQNDEATDYFQLMSEDLY